MNTLHWILLTGMGIGILASGVAKGQDLAGLIAKGDAADVAFQPDEALKHYLPAEQLAPKDAELLVKIARQYIYRMGELASVAEKIDSGKKGLDYAERAVKANPRLSDAHLAISICLGKIVQLQGNREKVVASKRIKETAERAVKLDPKNDYAWHLLGRWHQALAGMSSLVRGIVKIVYGELPPASNEVALDCFQKATKLRPDRLIHHIELGRTYAQMGNQEEARKALNKGLAMPNTEKDDPESKRRGREALAKL
jgi:tetratricopeptide (TPR) repeat protein